MPKLADKDTIEAAYQLWVEGTSIADIAEKMGLTIVQLQGWRGRHNWVARREKEEVEEQGSTLRKTGNSLFTMAPALLDSALNLAFNAESESVRATQQRYLLGAIGISPETAAERVRQLAMRQEELKRLVEEPIADVKDAIDVIEGKVGNWNG